MLRVQGFLCLAGTALARLGPLKGVAIYALCGAAAHLCAVLLKGERMTDYSQHYHRLIQWDVDMNQSHRRNFAGTASEAVICMHTWRLLWRVHKRSVVQL